VTELEEDLAEAQAKIDRLEGRTQARGFGERFLGAPTSIDVEREVDGEAGPEVHEEIADLVNRHIGGFGHSATVGRSLRYTQSNPQGGRVVQGIVRPSNGKTKVVLRERLGNIAGGLFGGVGGGAGVGLLGAIIPAAIGLGLRATVPLVCVLWLVFVYACVRGGYRRLVRARRRDLEGLGDDIRLRLVEAVGEPAKPAVRVGPAAARGSASDHAAEAEAEAEADLERETQSRARIP
jgi:hypothetical protein